MCNSQVLSPAQRLQYEQSWLQVPSKFQLPLTRARQVQEVLIHNRTRLLAWMLKSCGTPVVVASYQVSDLEVTARGPAATLTSNLGRKIHLTPRVAALQNSMAFIWFPALMDARYVPVDYGQDGSGRRQLEVSVCIATRGDHHRPVPKLLYLTEAEHFQELWPQPDN